MRITRILAGALSAALIGLVPVTLAAPAQAAESTVATLTASYKLIEYKGAYTPSLRADITTTSGGYVPSGGTVSLQASVAGGSWTTVRSEAWDGYFGISDVVPTKNTVYRVSFSGSDSYSASTSSNLAIKVARKIRLRGNDRTFVVKGKVTPKYAKKKVVIKVSKKEKRGFKKFKVIKTNRKGVLRVKLPKRRGTFYYRFITKGDKAYVSATYQIRATVY